MQNKTRHRPSYQDLARQPSRRKIILMTSKVRDTPFPLLSVSQNLQASNHSMCVEGLAPWASVCLCVNQTLLQIKLLRWGLTCVFIHGYNNKLLEVVLILDSFSRIIVVGWNSNNNKYTSGVSVLWKT